MSRGRLVCLAVGPSSLCAEDRAPKLSHNLHRKPRRHSLLQSDFIIHQPGYPMVVQHTSNDVLRYMTSPSGIAGPAHGPFRKPDHQTSGPVNGILITGSKIAPRPG